MRSTNQARLCGAGPRPFISSRAQPARPSPTIKTEASRRPPSFRLLTPQAFRDALRDSGAATWVLAPRKEYGPLEEMAGVPLARVREEGGFGLFLPER